MRATRPDGATWVTMDNLPANKAAKIRAWARTNKIERLLDLILIVRRDGPLQDAACLGWLITVGPAARTVVTALAI
jgi:hypothetical protein